MNCNKSVCNLTRNKNTKDNNIPQLIIPPLSKIRVSKRKMSISPRKQKQNQISFQKDNSYYTIKKKVNKKGRFSMKKLHISMMEKQIPKKIRRNTLCEIFQTKTKKYFQRYSLENEISYHYNSNINENNNILFLGQSPNSSYLQIENNLRNALNVMKYEIENKIKDNENKKVPYKNKLCSSPDLNILINSKTAQKIDGKISLLPLKPLLKKSKSLDYTEQYNKKLRKRMRNEIKEKIANENLFKRINEVVESDSENESLNIKNNKRNLSFSPNSNFIFIFDLLLIIANLFSFIFIPLSIARNENILNRESIFKEIIKYYNDIIYLFDFLISFFRGYYNYEMVIIRNNKRILSHYLKQDFFKDLIEGIPVYIIVKLFHKHNEVINFCHSDFKMFFCKLLLFIKSFKIFKIFGKKKNKALEDFYRCLSLYYYLEKLIVFLISFIIFLLFIHLFICLHIFFALQSYPNWISYTNKENETFINIYISSFYFLMTTMTTVGYGDIVCISSYERIFHIILLGIGTILYSFIVSKIGNYLRNESYEQMKLNKDLNILESIRLAYPAMPFKLYSKIQRHLLNIYKKRKKTGLSLLINGIPDTIKNELLLKIYSKVVNGFKIFKDIDNSNFILQVLTSFIPIISKKEEIFILEGELIDNIIFVKDGRLSIEVSIDSNDPYASIQNYIHKNFIGISKKQEIQDTNIIKVNSIKKRNYKDLKNALFQWI